MSEMTKEAEAAALMEQARWWLKPRQVKRGFVDGRFGFWPVLAVLDFDSIDLKGW